MTTQSEKFLAVAAIEEGTVIDHIPAGQALKIVEFLGLSEHDQQVSIGINLPSERTGRKDIIKVESRFLTPEEANMVAVFAPNATLSLIHGFEVSSKMTVEVPSRIVGMYRCPNPRCISNHEEVPSRFWVREKKPVIVLQCHFCQRQVTGREARRGL